MNRKKILYINHSRFFGGSEASLLDIIKHLNKSGYEPAVISPENPKLLKALADMKVQTIIFDNKILPYLTLPKYISNLCPKKSIFKIAYFTMIWLREVFCNVVGGLKMFFLIKSLRPQIIHANNWLSAQYLAPFLRYLGISSVFHLRDFDEKRLNRLADRIMIRLLSKFDRAIATSQAGHIFFKKMRHFPPEKTMLIYNGISLSFFDKTGCKSEYLQWPSQELEDELKGRFIFTQIGQICEGKGQRYFIQAAREVAQVMPEALFLIAGEEFKKNGQSKKGLIELIRKKGLQEKVKLIGYHQDIRPLLIHSDIIVIPSLEEAFGRVAAESMAMEKPIIASDIDSLREIIENDISGILVESADYKRLASAMVALAKDKNKMYRLGCNARKRIEENFDIRKQIKEIERLYSDLLKAKG